MRKRIVAGNWKMNKTLDESVELASEVCRMVSQGITTRSGVLPLVIMAPPFTSLKSVAEVLSSHSGIDLSAQNVAAWEGGAYTGEVSAAMVKSVGATWTLVGHSERRTLMGESDPSFNHRTRIAIQHGLKVIFCLGEVLEERQKNIHFESVEHQFLNGLGEMGELFAGNIVVAYEPVWAIGTGHTASPEQAGEMHGYVRELIRKTFGREVADSTPVLYGGSCKPDNAAELFAQPDVDGGLIGGASLDALQFTDIVRAL